MTDVNEGPTEITLADRVLSLEETTSTLQPVRLAEIVIADDAMRTNLLTLSGPDAEYFLIADGHLFLKAGTTLRASLKPHYHVRVEVADPEVSFATLGVDGALTILTRIPAILGPPLASASMRPTLQWSSISSAVGYEIIVREIRSGSSSGVVVLNQGLNIITLVNYSVNGTSYTPPVDLGIGRFVSWVRSVDSTGLKSAWSSSLTFNVTSPVTINPFPSIRQLLARPAVTWQPLPGAVPYDVWVDNRTVTPAISQYVRTEVTSASWTHSSDLPMGRYRVWVRGVDELGVYRTWSTFTDFVIAPSPTTVPVNSTFDRTPTFSWSPRLGAESYEIVVRSASNGAEVFRQSTTQTQATPSFDLGIGGYNWQVRALSVGGYSSNYTGLSSIFIGGRPVAQPIVVNNRVPTLSWLAVQGAAHYQVRVDRLDVPTINIINKTGLTGTQ